MRGRLLIVATSVALALGAGASTIQPAGAATVNEKIDGVLVAVPSPSGERQLLASPAVARGVFNGVGRFVELPSGDSGPILVDAVFAAGTLKLEIINGDDGVLEINARSCIFMFVGPQEVHVVEGGTGRFKGATGNLVDTLTARGVAARNPDGSCDENQAPVIEVDTVTASGTLTLAH